MPQSSQSHPAPAVTVVVPTYNERENLPRLAAELDALGMPGLRLLVVDDDSPDGTGQVAEGLSAHVGIGVDVLHRAEKNGLGRAYVAGMRRALDAGARIVVQMDADLSHPASVIPQMVDVLDTTDAAVVVGSRYVPGGRVASDWPWHRKALSWGANRYVDAILRLGVKDATAGFKAWRAETLQHIGLETVESNGYSFQVEMNHRVVRSGGRIAEVPIRFDERTEGASKMTLAVQWESVKMPWKLRFSRGGRVRRGSGVDAGAALQRPAVSRRRGRRA